MEVPLITAEAVVLEIPQEVISTPGALRSITAGVRILSLAGALI